MMDGTVAGSIGGAEAHFAVLTSFRDGVRHAIRIFSGTELLEAYDAERSVGRMPADHPDGRGLGADRPADSLISSDFAAYFLTADP